MSRAILTSTAEVEQQVLLYQSISVACLVLGGICLLLAIFLFWRFRVANIIAFKLGITARQSIRDIEKTNAAAETPVQEENVTTVLADTIRQSAEVTTRLDMAMSAAAEKLEILCDIMMLHTEEII